MCSEMGRWKKYENCGRRRRANLLGTFDFKVWERKGGKGRWIVKPPAMARGCGIKVFALSSSFYVRTFFGRDGLVLCRPGGEQVIDLVHFTSQLVFYSGGEQVEPDSEDPPPRCSKICRQALSH